MQKFFKSIKKPPDSMSVKNTCEYCYKQVDNKIYIERQNAQNIWPKIERAEQNCYIDTNILNIYYNTTLIETGWYY